ncbi:MAG: SDR family oxidoreductase [Clostridia bacterium]|nr:SDR family oxidoreductase [Clostridia bacterium]
MEKIVLITGGSRGIGASCVRAFANRGYKVAFTYLSSKQKADKIAKECGALAIQADISSSNQVNDAVDLVIKHFGRVDILVNNAGISEFSLFTDITDEMWQKMLDTNLSGAFYASRAVLPSMISRKAGCIVNIASMWGEVGASCEVHYSASKAGLIGMTKALAKEVALSGIRVNCVSPGAIDTDMNAHLTIEDIDAIKLETPLGRLGTPEEIANAVLFLASDEASFITGQILGVNGGMII